MMFKTNDIARRLGISPVWVRTLADRGTIPCQRTPDGTRLFTDEDVKRIERERARKTAPRATG